MYVCMNVIQCMHVCMNVCISLYMYVFMHACMHVSKSKNQIKNILFPQDCSINEHEQYYTRTSPHYRGHYGINCLIL